MDVVLSRTLAIITEAHLRLAQTNGVFALANAIESFKLGLIDTLLQSLLLAPSTTKAMTQP